MGGSLPGRQPRGSPPPGRTPRLGQTPGTPVHTRTRTHVYHSITCAPVCIRGQGCPIVPHLPPPQLASLADPCRAPTHRPLHAHQHVGQIFHFKVHQGEQRWADCKGARGDSGGAGLGCQAGEAEGVGERGAVIPGMPVGPQAGPLQPGDPASPTRPSTRSSLGIRASAGPGPASHVPTLKSSPWPPQRLPQCSRAPDPSDVSAGKNSENSGQGQGQGRGCL